MGATTCRCSDASNRTTEARNFLIAVPKRYGAKMVSCVALCGTSRGAPNADNVRQQIPAVEAWKNACVKQAILDVVAKGHRLVAIVLICVVVVCAVVLGVNDLDAPWQVAFTVASAVAGAALGNVLRLDSSDEVVRNQARPAVRHLFDQARRIRTLVQKAEAHQAAVESKAAVTEDEADRRVADWFGSLGDALRNEIDATVAAIDHWGDLTEDVRKPELLSYQRQAAELSPDNDTNQEA